MKKLKDLKVGDKVYDVIIGYGIVKAISRDKEEEYPIEVDFNDELGDSYGFDGRKYTSDNNPSLFLTNPFEQQGRWMMVSDCKKIWDKRFVILEKNGGFIAFSSSETDDDLKDQRETTFWKYAKEIPEPTEIILSMQEIADKFGVDVETLKIQK